VVKLHETTSQVDGVAEAAFHPPEAKNLAVPVDVSHAEDDQGGSCLRATDDQASPVSGQIALE